MRTLDINKLQKQRNIKRLITERKDYKELYKLNIKKEEIIAIGDGDNDIEMIKYVGIGIAMLNAPDIVKKHADIITKYSNNNDGIYDVLKNVLKNGVRYYNELWKRNNCFD